MDGDRAPVMADVARIAGDVDDLDPVPPHHCYVADGDAVRLEERHYDFCDEKIKCSAATQQGNSLVRVACIHD